MSKNSGDIFNGFSREMSDFLVELRFNNNREWFDNNRERYFSLLKEPMDSFVVAAKLNLNQMNQRADEPVRA